MQQIQDLTDSQTPLTDQDQERQINILKEREANLKNSKAPFIRIKHEIITLIFQILKCIDKEILNVKALINQTMMQFQMGQIITDQIINQQQFQQKFQKKIKLFSIPILNKMSVLNQMVCEEKNRKKKKIKVTKLDQNLVEIQTLTLKKKKSKNILLPSNLVQQFQSAFVKQEVEDCQVIAMNYPETQFIHGQKNELHICHFDISNEPITKQEIKNLEDKVQCLHFSKQGTWLIYGTNQSLKQMKINQTNEWICQQNLQSCANLIVINEDENQFITSQLAAKIEIWIKDQFKWCLHQMIQLKDIQLYSISANLEFNYLAVCGETILQIWGRQDDNTWFEKQAWSNPLNHIFSQVCFMENNELLVSTSLSLLTFIFQKQGIFQLNQYTKLNKNLRRVSLIYKKQLMILRNINQVFIFKKTNFEYKLIQIINGDYQAVYLAQGCEFFIMQNERGLKQIEIWKVTDTS